MLVGFQQTQLRQAFSYSPGPGILFYILQPNSKRYAIKGEKYTERNGNFNLRKVCVILCIDCHRDSHSMRRHIPKEYKDLALHMSINEGVSDNQILSYIGISTRAMRRL